MRHDLNQLSYYLAVCKHQNLTKAAAELSVSQPGLSAAIRTRKTGLDSGKGKAGTTAAKTPRNLERSCRGSCKLLRRMGKTVKMAFVNLSRAIYDDFRQLKPRE